MMESHTEEAKDVGERGEGLSVEGVNIVDLLQLSKGRGKGDSKPEDDDTQTTVLGVNETMN
jgi:hypothetical protein